MPTAETLKYTPSGSTSSTATAAPAAGVTATTGASSANSEVATSGPLTPTLGQARFKTTQAPATTTTAPKAKGAAGKNAPKLPTGKPVTTRAAVLNLIAHIGKGGPSHEIQTKGGVHLTPEARPTAPVITQMAGPSGITLGGQTNVGTPLVGEVNGKKVVLTDKVQAVINTIGQHVFKSPSFTISTAETTMTGKQWDAITAAATTRAHEREQKTELATAQKAATPGTTGTVTGQALYTLWLKTYQSGKTGLTPTTKAKTNAKTWNERFVAMGLTSSMTPTPAQAQTAYKSVLKMAQDGDTTATKVIRTQIKANVATLKEAELGQGTAQSASQYFVTNMRTIAHSYLIPMSTTTLNQRAAIAAQNAGDTYYARENELNDFKQTIQKQAAGLYPNFATQINKGTSMRTLTDPYAEVAAKTLGYGTASATTTAEDALGITWMNPKWNTALSGGKAATGKLSAPMSLTAWRQHLIVTPQYGWTKTATAKQVNASVGLQLAQAFGLYKP